MAYLSLYRKYRPHLFSHFTGQAHIIRTLENAIREEKINHAYLFAGPRGTGKTSTAKVFSKAINCEQGPDPPEPCNQCSTCKRIDAGNFMEILEIDAASNRGIDEIRQLKNNVRFYPTEGRFKVYIIDEVHMLTTEAFNALLKTLEEPPPYIVFILATTEPHRLLPTILSRCQRFDFKYLTTEEIIDRLSYVCHEEGVQIEEGALSLVARSAEGGMRDALSLLDQVLAYGVDAINIEMLSTMLGIIRQDIFIQLTECILKGETPSGLLIIKNLLEEGRDVEQVIKGLLFHFRNLLLVKECGKDPRIIDLPSEDLVQLEELSKRLEGRHLLQMVKILSQAQADLRFSNHPAFILERTFVHLAKLEDEGDLRAKVKRLEKMLEDGMVTMAKREEGAALEREKKRTSRPEVEHSKRERRGEREVETHAREKGQERRDGQIQAGADAPLQGNWSELMSYFHEKDKTIHASLLYCQPVEIDEDRLQLEFTNKIFLGRMEKKRDTICNVLNKLCDKTYAVEMVLQGSRKTNVKEQREQKSEQERGQREEKEERVERKEHTPSLAEDPRVKRILQEFNGKIVQIIDE